MIVKSILDTDLYKFTTSYAYMKLFPQARGTFEFFDRDLTEYPEDFVQKVYLELSNLGMLRLTNSELDYMTSNCRFVPDPIQDLWKTEVYGLANYLLDHYKSKALEALRNDYKETCDNYKAMSCAIYNSCKLVPTDGLGISNSDLDQIGAKDYATVDDILSRFIPFEDFRKSYDSAGQIMHPHDEMAESDCWSQLCARHGEDVVNKVWSRHLASEFKRKKAPIYISRELYE